MPHFRTSKFVIEYFGRFEVGEIASLFCVILLDAEKIAMKRFVDQFINLVLKDQVLVYGWRCREECREESFADTSRVLRKKYSKF